MPWPQTARMSIRGLAERLHISRANAYTRVERLRSSGVILGFRAEVSPEAVGLRTSAYVTLNLHQTEWRTVQSSDCSRCRGWCTLRWWAESSTSCFL